MNKPFRLYALSTLLVMLVFTSVQAAVRMTSETRYVTELLFHQYQVDKGKSDIWKTYTEMYPLYAGDGSFSLAFLGKVGPQFTKNKASSLGMEVGSQIGNIISLRVPVQYLDQLNEVDGLVYLEMAGKISPNLNHTLFDTRADSVQAGIGLPQPFTGEDILIGITDWGFDYTHPMFYDTGLTQTRILAAWDQFKVSGPTPAGYSYGTEHNTPMALLAAQSDTSNIYGYGTHGSHVAGIAGGSGMTTVYKGVAYSSQFLMVTIKVDLAAVLDAFAWMKGKADAEGKRLVVNMSWGLYFIGTLDGQSLISQAIDQLSSEGVVFVNSGGNNGDANFHIKKSFSGDTLKTRVNFYSYTDPSIWGQSVNMWGEQNHSFATKAVFLDASNAVVGETPLFHTQTDTNFLDTILVLGADTIFYKLEMHDQHPVNGKCHARFMIRNRFSYYKVALVATADSGVVHCWNLAVHQWNEGNWGIDFTSLGVGYTAGDKNYGISEPAVTQSLITVAAHNAEYLTPGGVLTGGNVATFSSFGPTIDGRMKPDVSAPGVNVVSSISYFTTGTYPAAATYTFNSRVYKMSRLSGTSMSSPATAGVAALILDANPYLTSQQVKDIIMVTAREDVRTGDIPDSGSTRWGQGKVDAYAAVLLALNTIGVEGYVQNEMIVYPNPSSGNVYLYYPDGNDEVYTLQIFTTDGKMVQSSTYQWGQPVDMSPLQNGIYIFRLTGKNSSYHCRVVRSGS